MRQVLKGWAENEFKTDPQLNLIPTLYNKLRSEGYEFPSTTEKPKSKLSLPKDPNVVSSQQEEDDLAKAIELSLKETKGSPKNHGNSAADGSAGAAGASSSAYVSFVFDFCCFLHSLLLFFAFFLTFFALTNCSHLYIHLLRPLHPRKPLHKPRCSKLSRARYVPCMILKLPRKMS